MIEDRAPLRRRRGLLIGALVVVALLAGVVLRFSPLAPGPGLPAGATRLFIITAAPHLMPTLGCPVALLQPTRVETVDDELILRFLDNGGQHVTEESSRARVVWPAGWIAWRVDGTAELVARDGTVFAREGDVLDDLGGGVDDEGAFRVCIIGT